MLLVRIVDPLDSKPPVWITPGGSLEGNESLAEAAARELHEETGLSVTPDELGEPMAVCRGDWEYRGAPLRSEDWYFGLRAGRFVPQTDGYTELEREVHGLWRWWTPDELEDPDEVVLPRGLPQVARLILRAENVDDHPMVLPWTVL